MSGRGGGFGRNSPTYADLMLATDEAGRRPQLSGERRELRGAQGARNEEPARPRRRQLRRARRPSAQSASFLKDRHAVVSAFYLSNVEQYLNMDGLWATFCSNVATLPLDDSSRFIRSVRQGQYRYGPGLSSILGIMSDEIKTCGSPTDIMQPSPGTAMKRTAAQNVNLTASCMMRASPDRLEIVPNVAASLMFRFGRPKLVVLNRLKMSHRSVAAMRSLNLICAGSSGRSSGSSGRSAGCAARCRTCPAARPETPPMLNH